jgi:hypothetical protein
VKGKTDKAVEKIDAILEGYFSSLPPRELARKERAFINAAKKIDVRAKQPERPKSADRPGDPGGTHSLDELFLSARSR